MAKSNYRDCVGKKLRGRHFNSRKAAQDAMRKAAKECAR